MNRLSLTHVLSATRLFRFVLLNDYYCLISWLKVPLFRGSFSSFYFSVFLIKIYTISYNKNLCFWFCRLRLVSSVPNVTSFTGLNILNFPVFFFTNFCVFSPHRVLYSWYRNYMHVRQDIPILGMPTCLKRARKI